MAGLLDTEGLNAVFFAWRRALRADELLSRAALPDLRPFAGSFNSALAGEDTEPLSAACDALVREAELQPRTVIRLATLLAATFTDELGTASGATTRSLLGTLGYVCERLTTTMVRDVEVQARRDTLTGLENRIAWEEELARSLTASGGNIALAILDLDGLKQVNDSEGHAAGDTYLREFAVRLRTSLPDGPRAYRFGGDEYSVIFPNGTFEQATELLTTIRDGGSAPFSFGIAVSPIDGEDAESLKEQADARMYEEKRRRKEAKGQA